ncbi:hypothetical protein CJO94_02635 [Ralstonia solanacearum]|nr:hypothetical protein CJO94_02635 [Ralstonia solanacearum]
MKSKLGTCLLAAWLVLTAWSLNDWWGTHLDSIPKPPEALGSWLIKLAGATNAEEAGDVDFLFGLAIAFVVVSILTWLLLAAFRHGRVLIQRSREKAGP